FDGAGFPHKKRGAEISLGASIVRLADQIELALRGSPLGGPLSGVARVLARERGAGVPTPVADAAAELFGSGSQLLELLSDQAALDETLGTFCPPAPGTEEIPRNELLTQLLWVLARVVDAKHSHTMGHSARVAYLGFRIAQGFGDEVNAWDV